MIGHSVEVNKNLSMSSS